MTGDNNPLVDEHPQPPDQTEPPDDTEPQQPAEPQKPSDTDAATPKTHSKKPWIALGVAVALVAGSIGLWRFLSPTLSRQLPGTISGVTYESSGFIPTNLSATACQILDGGKLGPCTTVHVDGDSIAPSRNFKIGGLKRGVPYAVYVTADESWPTWFGTDSNKPFRQGLPAMDDVTKYPFS